MTTLSGVFVWFVSILSTTTMSLVCETIVSDDELSRASDEELDFEPNDSNQTANVDIEANEANVRPIDEDSRDEGEVDDDDDLEEGEVKEDDVPPVADANRRAPQPNNGQRIAAPNDDPRAHSVCRFFGRGQCTWGNACRFMHTTRDAGLTCVAPKRAPPLPPPPMPPAMARRGGRDESESAWERGLKQAKEMIVRASRRKEQEVDFEDKRFNLGVADDRDSSPERQLRPPPTDDEYERRRRLAFESAPWNTASDAKTRAAETYRDPWRRSKSPPKSARRPLTAGSKRSHSMSSISASASDSSDFSGSDSASEFSDSSASSATANRQRFSRRTAERPKDSDDARPKKVTQPSAAAVAKSSASEPKAAYDSWSESLSDSDSISSYYSASNSDSEASRDSKYEPKGRPKKSAGERPLKKNKVAATPLSPLLPSKKADPSEAPKKSPIKMTFMKKHSKIKKDNLLANKLNGGRDKAEPEAMEASAVAADEDEDSRGGASGRDAPLASPLSTEALSPPESEGGVGSKSTAIDKQSLSATVSRREELLQQLRAVEDAIARKRSKIN